MSRPTRNQALVAAGIAGVVLAKDAKDNSATKAEVRSLRDQVSASNEEVGIAPEAVGEIHLAGSQDEMFELVEKAIADPTAFATSTDGAAIAAAIAKFEELVDGLFEKKRSPR